jgi:hypothetical protein
MEKAGLLNKTKKLPQRKSWKKYSASEKLRYSPFHSVTFTLSTIDIAKVASNDNGLVRWCPAMQIT